MTEYLYWSGVVINVLIACFILLVIWVWFIWPFIEAVSITYVAVKALMISVGKPKIMLVLKNIKYWYADMLFGRRWERISNDVFEWRGVCNYRIYGRDDFDEETE